MIDTGRASLRRSTPRRAIVTNDKTLEGGFSFTRTGYIALYKIADIEKDTTLRFSFTKRLAAYR
jgi:hypothetical protein